MTKTLLVLGALALAVPGYGSACPMHDEDAAKKHLEMMAKELGLTEDQKAKVRAIKDEKHEKMAAVMKESRDRVNALLTPEQQKKFENMKSKKGHCEMCGMDGKGKAG